MSALVVLTAGVLVGSMYLLVTVPTATWVIPLCVAAFGGLVGFEQWNIQHSNAEKLAEIQRGNSEKLAMISGDLRRNSMHYERRLDATVAAVVAMRSMSGAQLLASGGHQ
jgi:hypothetical protein